MELEENESFSKNGIKTTFSQNKTVSIFFGIRRNVFMSVALVRAGAGLLHILKNIGSYKQNVSLFIILLIGVKYPNLNVLPFTGFVPQEINISQQQLNGINNARYVKFIEILRMNCIKSLGSNNGMII